MAASDTTGDAPAGDAVTGAGDGLHRTAVRWLSRLGPIVIIAAVWEFVAQTKLVSELAFPTLISIASAFVTMVGDDLLSQTAISLARGGVALGCAVVFGTVVGVLMALYWPVRALVNPVMQALYPMPKSALIPVFIIWLGLGDQTKVALIFIGCLLPILISSYNAVRGVDEKLLWSARSLGATNGEVIRQVILPAAMPPILSGIRTSISLAFILLVSAELIIANNGIGYLIGLLGENGDYARMFAAVITISVIGFAADRLYLLLMARLLSWRTA